MSLRAGEGRGPNRRRMLFGPAKAKVIAVVAAESRHI